MAAGFDQYAEDYESALHEGLAITGETQDYFARGRVNWLALQLRSMRGMSGPRILDYGCGVGNATPFLHAAFQPREIVGVDISDSSLRIARHRHGHLARFVEATALQSLGTFDLAFCNGVFHHIPPGERDEVLRSVFAVVGGGGFFSLWENNPFNPGTRYVMSRIPFDRGAILLRSAEVRRRAVQAGFEVAAVDYLFVFPRVFSWLRPIEPLLRRWPIGAQYQVLLRKRDIFPTETEGRGR